MVKMQLTDNQTAFEYAIYMIVGSYFNKTSCKNVLQERKMRLQYCEQKLDKQYKMEDMCIAYVEQELRNKIPSRVWDEKVMTRLIVNKERGMTEIRFISHEYILCISGIYRGKNSEFNYKLYRKVEKQSKNKKAA